MLKGGKVVQVNAACGCLAGDVKAGDPQATAAKLLEQLICDKQAVSRPPGRPASRARR